MSWVVEILNRWGMAWTSLVGVALWQSTLVALVVALAAVALRRWSPAVRYWLWQLVPIKLLVIPLGLWSIALPWLPSRELPAELPAVSSATRSAEPEDDAKIVAVAKGDDDAPKRESKPNAASPAPPAEIVGGPVGSEASSSALLDAQESAAALNWQAWLFVAWTIVVGLQVLRLLAQYQKLNRLLAATSPAEGALLELVASAAKQLELPYLPAVRTTECDCSPLVCGLRRPTLVLPRALVQELAPGELRQVLAHELAHLKRRDLLWGWITELARMLYFFHPVIHWAAYQVRLERELACDAAAMRTCNRTAAQYAETLVRVLSAVSSVPALGSAAASLDGGQPLSGEEHKP